MFSFLKFRKNQTKQIAQFYQHADLEAARWVTFAVNQRTINQSVLTKELEIITESDAYSIKIAESKNETLHQIWQNQVKLGSEKGEIHSALNLAFNQLQTQLIEQQIGYFQKLISQKLSTEPFSAQDRANDQKALEWMRVSFLMLEKGAIESLTNPELLFQCLSFFGINPKTDLMEIRIIAFNLDIKFELLLNGSLRVRIYNDKEGVLGTTKKAALEGDFNFRKREMLDELTRLISCLSKGFTIF